MDKRSTIVIPVFNDKEGIGKTLESAVRYRNDQVEIIIVDGNSTDGTVDVIQRYLDQVDYFISEKDNGLYEAMNKGIKAAHGEWLFFLASGDVCVCDPSWIVKTYGKDDVEVIAGGIIKEMEDGLYQCDLSKPDLGQLDHWCSIRHPAAFFRRSAYERYGGYSERFTCAGDREWFLRAREQGARFRFIQEYIVIFQFGGISSKKIAAIEDRMISQMYGISKAEADYIYYKKVIRKIGGRVLNMIGMKKERYHLSQEEVMDILKKQEYSQQAI